MRVLFGQILVWALGRFNLASVPSSDELFTDNKSQVAKSIQAAMDAVDESGKRAGWIAGKAVIASARQAGDALFKLSEWWAVTLFMGLSGSNPPRTVAGAQKLLNELRRQYDEAGHPDFLFAQAHAEVVRQLQDADRTGNWFSAGVLQKMFDVRKDKTPPLGHRAREAAVLMFFKQHRDYVKFLSRDEHGELALPAGTSYEEFASAMLANAYGPYPD